MSQATEIRDELVAALVLCEAVLHPGAVGLIANEHGEEAGERACQAVYAIRRALAKASPQMDLTGA